MDRPIVSVIITTHTWGRYGAFKDAIRSVENQTYDKIEVILPLDGDPDMVETTEVITDGGAQITHSSDAAGLSRARNRGAEQANGNIYAFLDDDCIASSEWVAELVDAFEDGAIAAGGPALPDWPDERPWYIPTEYDWLVGAGPYEGEEKEIRNTYGCNIAFRADVFDSLGGFDETLGKNGNLNQGEETELCARMIEEFGEGVRFKPDASVRHTVFPEQLRIGHLLARAYHQGVSKRKIGLGDEEGDFLGEILKSMLRNHPLKSFATLTLTASVGFGFAFGGRGPS